MNNNKPGTGLDERGCERAEELVSYLYGESSTAETASFRQHLSACNVCRDELAAFGGVRAGIGEWRAEALSAMPTLALGGAFAPESNDARATVRRRSARTALREFFALSPLWLRAGALAATLLVCALAALSFARTEIRWNSGGLAIRSGVGDRVIEKRVEVPTTSGLSEEQLEALVGERVRRELEVARAQAEANEEEQEGVRPPMTNASKKSAPRLAKAPDAAAARAARRTPDAPPARRARQNLARYDEEDLPRLVDLLDEVK